VFDWHQLWGKVGEIEVRGVTLRILAGIAAVQDADAWLRTARNQLNTAASSAQLIGAVIGLLLVGGIIAFGVLELWRLRRSGLIVVAGLYVITVVLQLLAVHRGSGNWLNVVFSGLMLLALLSPHAWRICSESAKSEQAKQSQSEPAL
jgi:uncharacterized membrane protein